MKINKTANLMSKQDLKNLLLINVCVDRNFILIEDENENLHSVLNQYVDKNLNITSSAYRDEENKEITGKYLSIYKFLKDIPESINHTKNLYVKELHKEDESGNLLHITYTVYSELLNIDWLKEVYRIHNIENKIKENCDQLNFIKWDTGDGQDTISIYPKSLLKDNNIKYHKWLIDEFKKEEEKSETFFYLETWINNLKKTYKSFYGIRHIKEFLEELKKVELKEPVYYKKTKDYMDMYLNKKVKTSNYDLILLDLYLCELTSHNTEEKVKEELMMMLKSSITAVLNIESGFLD